MRVRRSNTVIAALTAVLAMPVLVAQIGASQGGQTAVKLEGAWVARVTTFQGQPFPYLSQWSYVLQPDPSGRRATLHGSVDLRFPSSPIPNGFNSPLIGECVMTGPATARCYTIWYTIQEGDPLDSIVDIGTAKSEIRLLEAGKSQVTHNFAIYLPAADADKDGFPDDGAVPQETFTVTTLDTRLPLPF